MRTSTLVVTYHSTCDQCGLQVDTTDETPAGWTTCHVFDSQGALNVDLCPTCSVPVQQLKASFEAARVPAP